MKRFCFFVLSFILASCSSKIDKKWVKSELANHEWVQDVKEFIPFRFYKQPKIYILKDYLIIYSPLSADRFIDIYKKSTFKYLTSTAIRGNGPSEITAPGPITIDETNNCFWLADFGKMHLYKFAIDSIVEQKDYKPSYHCKLPNGIGFMEFSFIDQDTIIANPLQLSEAGAGQVMVKKINLKNQSLIPTNYKIPEQIKTDNYYSAWLNFYYSKENKIMIGTYGFSDLIVFMDSNGEIFKSIEGPKGIKKISKTESLANLNIAYNQITGDNQYVFALFNGNKMDKSNILGSSGHFIRIFRINGEYIKTLDLKDNLANICYDTDNKRIIAISNDRENSIIYFDINF